MAKRRKDGVRVTNSGTSGSVMLLLSKGADQMLDSAEWVALVKDPDSGRIAIWPLEVPLGTLAVNKVMRGELMTRVGCGRMGLAKGALGTAVKRGSQIVLEMDGEAERGMA